MLTDAQVLASEIVANATMNRGRGFGGVNSYTRELRFDIPAFLETRVRKHGTAAWYDACCGEGNALAEASRQFASADWGRHVQIIGVDLVGTFSPVETNGLRLIAEDVGQFTFEVPIDLVTCVHGLHYLGDKLGFLAHAYAMLRPGGIFLGHLDPANLRLPTSTPWSRLLRQLRAQGVDITLKNHILRLAYSNTPLDFGLTYQGATISEQPNYTGITVMDSWYA